MLQVTETGLGVSEANLNLWKLNYEYGELNANGTVDSAKNTGNLAKQTISFGGAAQDFVQTYKYDALYRLTEAKEESGSSQNWKQTFGYDKYGNRTAFSQVIGSTNLPINSETLPTVDVNTNRYSPSQGYSYDKAGNVVADAENRTFVFNGDNKQVEVKDASNNVIGTYLYDGDGKRIKKVTANEETVFVYSGGKLAAEYSTDIAPTASTKYVATDTLGSIRAMSDQNGDVVSRRDFMPFGEEMYAGTPNRDASQKYSTDGDNVRQKFTGYERDKETGLDFAEARYYKNNHGRFTAVDPLLASGKSANPQTFNRYAYVMNNPLAYTDPTGLQAGRKIKKVNNQFGQQVYTNGKVFRNAPGKGFRAIKKDEIVKISIGEGYTVVGRQKSWELRSPSNALKLAHATGRSVRIEDRIAGIGKGIGNAIPDAVNGTSSLVTGGLNLQYGTNFEAPQTSQWFTYSNSLQAGYGSAGSFATQIAIGGAAKTIGSGLQTGLVPATKFARTPSTLAKTQLEFTNRLSPGNLKKLGRSIADDGINEPITFTRIGGANFVVDGNHRLGLAFKFGFDKVPVRQTNLPFGQFKSQADVLNSAVPKEQITNSTALRYFRLKTN